MLVAIGLVYLIIMILFRSVLVPLMMPCALPLAVVGAFLALAMTGHKRKLSTLHRPAAADRHRGH